MAKMEKEHVSHRDFVKERFSIIEASKELKNLLFKEFKHDIDSLKSEIDKKEEARVDLTNEVRESMEKFEDFMVRAEPVLAQPKFSKE